MARNDTPDKLHTALKVLNQKIAALEQTKMQATVGDWTIQQDEDGHLVVTDSNGVSTTIGTASP